VAKPPTDRFDGVLRRLRLESGLTQEELAAASGLSLRAISDLERGIVTTPHKDTVRLLADALLLDGSARVEFEAVARVRVTLGRSVAQVTAATRTLPRDIASFTGRAHELQELSDAAAAAGSVVSIRAIGGMAGIGKTAFAVHAAHAMAGRFPGGQVFLPLHGHTPGRQPVSPADALASLLLTIGVPAGQIPADLEARTGLWRDRLAGRQLLLVLDDAADSEQVRPLLPGAGGSLVLVTSRRRLTALEDARTISLETLPPGEAAELFLRLADRTSLSSADPEVGEITRLCGFLPLAIGMLARQLNHHPAWTLAGRAAELAAAVDRLEQLATENLSVAAAFDLSYNDLTPGQQRLFRRLGLHPGADIDAYAAGALDGTGLAAARRGLDALYDQYLLTEPVPGWYRMHDLIREHARVLASRVDSHDDQELAIGRLLDYYQHAAARAEALLALQARTAAQAPSPPPAAVVPALASRDQALSWARAERASLLACLDQVTATGQHARVIGLTAGLAGLLRHDGPWAEAITRHAAAVQAARHLGDRPGQAGALTDLGELGPDTGDYPGAARDLEAALDIYRDLGDQPGQARALLNLGIVRLGVGNYPEAARDLDEALRISRDIGDRPGQACGLYHLGSLKRMAGDYLGAARDLEESLGISRDIGDRFGQANALNFLGGMRALTGDYPAAARDQEEALDIYRELGARPGQGYALTAGGLVRLKTGDYQGASRDLQEALGIYRDLGDQTGQANALLYLGRLRLKTEDFQGAAQDLQEALGLFRDVGYRHGQVVAFIDYGTLSRTQGDLGRARSWYRQAIDLAREIGATPGEAHALAGVARCAVAEGRTAEAETGLRQALAIFQRIGDAAAADVSAELAALTGLPGPPVTNSGWVRAC